MVSGCALIGDYILTIAISVASGADAMFSMLPVEWQVWKLKFSVGVVIFLTLLNLRGVKESVVLWVPVFFVFVFTYTFAIIWAISAHFGELPDIAHGVVADVQRRHRRGRAGSDCIAVMLRAYSLGAGTYTGIEAVSNGLNTLREPRVQTGKRTMIYMAASLSFVVGGLLLAYLLYHVDTVEGKTLNAVLFEKITAAWPPLAVKGVCHRRDGFLRRAAVHRRADRIFRRPARAGQHGGGPLDADAFRHVERPARHAKRRAADGRRGAAVIVLLHDGGRSNMLVVLYSINVFITFSLSQLGMVRHWWLDRAQGAEMEKQNLLINGLGLLLTGGILVSLCVVKFFEGGWVTLLVTGVLIGVAFWVKRHYRQTQKKLHRLNELVAAALADERHRRGENRRRRAILNARTAVFLVNGFNGLGLHTLLAVVRMFPKVYRNFIFVQVGVLDAGNFKGAAEVENLREHSRREVERYVDLHEQARILCRGAFRAGHGHRGRGGEIVRRHRRKISAGAVFCRAARLQG